MADGTISAAQPVGPAQREKVALWCVRLAQVLFVAIALLDLDGPFLSAHNERQNQSFDMARHVYRDGWQSVITPKVSYVYVGYESLRYSASLQEVPFNGLIMWPLVRFTGHERALCRLVAIAFSLAAIQLLYLILRHWLAATISAAATVIFALSPLLLHFGQVPMPDIICTAGMLAAFLWALRGKLAGSSAFFAFAILAKLSVIVYGLPILVALLVARQCRTPQACVKDALAWGWFPLLCIATWFAILYAYAPRTHMTISGIVEGRGHWYSLIRLRFYAELLGPLFAFGAGVIGFLGFLAALLEKKFGMDRRIKWAIVISNLVFIICVFRKVPEPQYLVASLPWLIIGGAFGFNYLINKWRASVLWRTALGAAIVLHVVVAIAFTVDLKSSRVREYDDIVRASKLLPRDTRVLVVYRYYGAGPAVWLDQNVLPLGRPDSLEGYGKLHDEGFNYVLLLDVDSWHDADNKGGLLAIASRIFHVVRKAPDSGADPAYFTGSTSFFRQFCDQHFTPLFTAPRVVLYSIPDQPAAAGKP